GFGIYLLWPAFFSDLTNAYRLSRTGRLRADLGGLYFSGLAVAVLSISYAITGARWLLIVVLLQHLMVLQQCLPFLRLDGYYVLSDLVGVPDLFSQMRPLLRGLIPGRKPAPSPGGLKRGARIAVRIWVLATVPVLAAGLLLLGLRMPQILVASFQLARFDSAQVFRLALRGRLVSAAVGTVAIIVLVIPFAGLMLTLTRMAKAALTKAARTSRHRDRAGSPRHSWERP
ncbi:MAG TPA: hypothetical protein VKY26_01480, partial [Actinomycetota bacterium]|nr:hypothetical protein [Actinomycetota bacterium]